MRFWYRSTFYLLLSLFLITWVTPHSVFSDTTSYTSPTSSLSVSVGPQTVVLAWKTPAPIAAGTALGAAQLNATANIPGTFTYVPAAGTILAAGTNTLNAIFTPNNLSTYRVARISETILVSGKATPVITWATPASITQGTPLSATQLNATASVPGTFVYTPGAGTVLPTGSQTLSTTFTPTDTVNYNNAAASVGLMVTPVNTGSNVNPGMTTAQIQSVLNAAPTGATVNFAPGNYTITVPLTIPCRNLQLIGPTANTPTAILAANYTNNVLLAYGGGCATLGVIRYLGFKNTGAVYFGIGNNANFIFQYNTVSSLPSNLSNTSSQAGLYFDGNLSTKTSNILVQYNTFGDSSSCTAVFATPTDEGGYCAGILVGVGESNNFTIQSNIFEHVEEGIHFFQIANYNPGQPNSVCVSCNIDTNYIAHYHRIGIEMQMSTPTNSLLLQHNVVIDPIASSWGTFAVSLACCQSGYTIGVNGYSPALVFNDNVLISSLAPGSEPPPYGVEFWGTGSQGTNSLVQGNFSNGYTWGYGAGNWAINNNYICGPNYVSQGGYISNQQNQNNPPAQSGNTTAPSCKALGSTAPTIDPPSGSFTGSQVVTLSNVGANTGIWYTTDGSTPTPGVSTLYTTPITINATTTVKAVGMWGAPNQPTSYAAGYGYVPSTVVTATYTSTQH